MAENGFRAARRELGYGRWLPWYFAAATSGLMVPALFVLAGVAAWLLQNGSLEPGPLRLGRHLVVPIPRMLAAESPTTQLMVLTALGILFGIVYALLLWATYRGLLSRSRAVMHHLHLQLLDKMIGQSGAEGVAAQRTRAEQLIDRALPQLQQGLIAWWRSIPRGLLGLLACVIVAALVDVWLAALATIGGLLVWRLIRWIDGTEEDASADWELPRARGRLVELLQQAPLLARVQPGGGVGASYEAELKRLLEFQSARDQRWAKLLPITAAAIAAVVGVLVMALGINTLDPDSGLSLPAALVLALSLAGAGAAASRLATMWRRLGPARDAAGSVYSFLDRANPVAAEERMGLAGVREAVELRDVSLRDGHGSDLLASLSLRLQPGTLVALLGTDPVAIQALVELLLGFGRPDQGEVLIDGLRIHDVHPRALARHVFWVGRDGPLWSGTIEENLRGAEEAVGLADLTDVTRRVGVYDRIQQLDEGFATQVGPDDVLLDDRARYGLGIARALLRRPAVMVVQEPSAPPEDPAHDRCLETLRSLATAGTLVIVLPRRLQTLRSADRVVLLHGARLAGEGLHAQLLETSDLYRHLNYVLFNPYRHLDGRAAR